jgi:hypothetical protein
MGRLPLFTKMPKKPSSKYLEDFSTLVSVTLETLYQGFGVLFSVYKQTCTPLPRPADRERYSAERTGEGVGLFWLS